MHCSNWVCSEMHHSAFSGVRGVSVSGESKRCASRLCAYGYDDFLRLNHELGLNTIRWLVFWDAIEPEPGQYDQAYLDAVCAKLEQANRAGLQVIIDMHQDVYGASFGFVGAPRWTVDDALCERFRRRRQGWFLHYFDPSVVRAFDCLWTEERLIGALAGAWNTTARWLRRVDVLGYELINEPFWGSKTPAEFERSITPTYELWIDAIREGDPKPWILVPPASAVNLGIGTRLGRPQRDRLAYAPHFYPPSIELGLGYYGDRAMIERHVQQIARDAARLEMPAIITEFGVRRDVSGAGAFLRDAMDAFARHDIGSVYWDLGRGGKRSYGLWDEQGKPALQAQALVAAAPTTAR